MGHGAARTLDNDDRPIEPIPSELSQRIEAAFKNLDSKDEAFKQSREDERHQQISKAWNNVAMGLVEDLRHLGKEIVAFHQVLCDCGSEGAGVTTAPFLEEAMQRFPRMNVRLRDSGAYAECDGHELASIDDFNAIDYDWLRNAATEWIVWAVANRT